MKPKKPSSWSCRLVRLGASLGDEGTVPSWARRHLAACPSCQEHYAAAVALDHGLRAAAPAQTRAPRPALEHDIMREIMATVERGASRETAQARAARPRRAWAAFAVTGAAACAVALVYLSRPQPVAPAVPAAGAHGPTVASASNPPQPGWSQLAVPVRSLLAEDPLRSEAQHVVAEARSAVDFLALNFLPHPVETEQEANL